MTVGPPDLYCLTVQNATDDERAEFRLTLERAGLHCSEEDLPGLWEQFQQARTYARALDRWDERVRDVEPQGTFVLPAGP